MSDAALSLPASPVATAASPDPRGGARLPAASTGDGAHFDRLLQSAAARADEAADSGSSKPTASGDHAAASAETKTAADTEPAGPGTPTAAADAQTLASLIQALLGTATPAAASPTADPAAPMAAPASAPVTPAAVVANTPQSATATLPAATTTFAPTGGPAADQDVAFEASALLGAAPLASGLAERLRSTGTGGEESATTPIGAALATLLSTVTDAATPGSPVNAAAAASAPAVMPREIAATAGPAPGATTLPATALPTSTLDPAELPLRLGERLRWLVDGGLQEARLRLHPRELGAIDIRVQVDAGTAKVWFTADHPAARAALETALPQLRERFASEGLALSSPTVSSQSQGREAGGQPSARHAGGGGGFAPDAADEEAGPVWRSAATGHDGLIDRYA